MLLGVNENFLKKIIIQFIFFSQLAILYIGKVWGNLIYTIYKFRYRIGLVSIISGLGGMTIGVLVAHFAGFPKGEVIDYFNWIPRGWLPQTIGQLLAFGASQLLLLGLVLVVWNQKELTWAKATYLHF